MIMYFECTEITIESRLDELQDCNKYYRYVYEAASCFTSSRVLEYDTVVSLFYEIALARANQTSCLEARTWKLYSV